MTVCRDQVLVFDWRQGTKKWIGKKEELSQQVNTEVEKYRGTLVLFCNALERRRRLIIQKKADEKEPRKDLVKDRGSWVPKK